MVLISKGSGQVPTVSPSPAFDWGRLEASSDSSPFDFVAAAAVAPRCFGRVSVGRGGVLSLVKITCWEIEQFPLIVAHYPVVNMSLQNHNYASPVVKTSLLR